MDMSDIRNNRLLELLVKILESYKAYTEKGAFDGADGLFFLPIDSDIDAAADYLVDLDLNGDATQIRKEFEYIQFRAMHRILMHVAVGQTPEEQQAARERFGDFPLPSEDPEELKKDTEVMESSSSGAAILAADRIRSLIQHVMELDNSPVGTKGDELPPLRTGLKKGVSLRDAAHILTDEDSKLVSKMIKRWRNSTFPKLSGSIGIDPDHHQRNLYEPSVLSDFLEETDGKSACDEHKLRSRLIGKARLPKGE
jgi:hypothetical protein